MTVLNMLHKIREFIEKNKIRPSDCIYHTYRPVANRNKELKGEIRILVMNDNIARCEYICPECGKYDYLEKKWKRPFSVKCKNCGYLIRVPRMKDEIKRSKSSV